MPKKPSHSECIDLLANPSTQNILEKLGYEYSDHGLSQYRETRPNIVPILVRTIVTELGRHLVFPPEYRDNTPEIGVYVYKKGNEFVLNDIDKPSIWTEYAFSSSEDAARAYIQMAIDRYWLTSDPKPVAPISVQFSWH